MEKFLQGEIIKSKYNGNVREIMITDEIIERIEPIEDLDYNKAPISMELFFLLIHFWIPKTGEEDYELILSPNPGSLGAGKTFGRFMYFLDDNCQKRIKNINKIEKIIIKMLFLLKLYICLDSGRTANICISDNYRIMKLSCPQMLLNQKNNQFLWQIFDRTTYNQFYIKSKSLQKEW